MVNNAGGAVSQVTFLNVPFREKDEAKALGARWNPEQRLWYVPAGIELALFERWLPAQAQAAIANVSSTTELQGPQSDYAVGVEHKGIRLSQLLDGVSTAVNQMFRSGVWTMVEVVNAQLRGEHVFLELSERDEQGQVLAQARAVIWANVARTLLPRFQQETGVQLAPGIKLLVQARPSFHAQYGFSLFINDIDPKFTLGDLEAKKREIITRLKQEGIFAANKLLPSPWDYYRVLVVSPQQAAGLGDFQVEAQRLQELGLCEFVYVHARFQGEGAPAEIRQTLLAAVQEHEQLNYVFDAVVIIRGGGAVNDLAWLNDYDLAQAICTLGIPVLTGIGHERDHTVLDEVAHISFDTPSKVIAGVWQLISARAIELKTNFEYIQRSTQQLMLHYNHQIGQSLSTIQLDANQALARARHNVQEHIETTRNKAHEQLNAVRGRIPVLLEQVRARGTTMLQATGQNAANLLEHTAMRGGFIVRRSREQVEHSFAQIAFEAPRQVQTAKAQTQGQLEQIMQHTRQQTQHSKESLGQNLTQIQAATRRQIALTKTELAQCLVLVQQETRRQITTARQSTTALFREVAGLGPEKTLERGFALVRDDQGKVLTDPTAAEVGQNIKIEFNRGSLHAQITQIQGVS